MLDHDDHRHGGHHVCIDRKDQDVFAADDDNDDDDDLRGMDVFSSSI